MTTVLSIQKEVLTSQGTFWHWLHQDHNIDATFQQSLIPVITGTHCNSHHNKEFCDYKEFSKLLLLGEHYGRTKHMKSAYYKTCKSRLAVQLIMFSSGCMSSEWNRVTSQNQISKCYMHYPTFAFPWYEVSSLAFKCAHISTYLE